MSVDEAIREFWTWWSDASLRIARVIENGPGFSDALLDEIAARVSAIGDLDWELGPGKTATHAFCLSPRGVPEARVITELWKQRGPQADATWEYFAARQPTEGMTLTISGVSLQYKDLRVVFDVDVERERIDAQYIHPQFRRLAGAERETALYLLLADAFGEDGIDRWLGGIEALVAKPANALSFERLQAAFVELVANATSERFAIIEDADDTGSPILFTVNRALKRVDHVLFTVHAALDLAILDQNAVGLTTQADADVLNRLEDELTGVLGPHAVFFGRETRRGHRVLHWYVPEDGAGPAIIERWAKAHPDRAPALELVRDPAWEFVERLV
jgi:hypothetical protein